MQNNLKNELSDEMLDTVAGGQAGEWVADVKCWRCADCAYYEDLGANPVPKSCSQCGGTDIYTMYRPRFIPAE